MVNTIGNKTINGNVSELNLNTTSNVNSFREVYNMNTFSFPKPKPISKKQIHISPNELSRKSF